MNTSDPIWSRLRSEAALFLFCKIFVGHSAQKLLICTYERQTTSDAKQPLRSFAAHAKQPQRCLTIHQNPSSTPFS